MPARRSRRGSPRPGYFDSWLVEAGPPAIITEKGIVLRYNAGNSGRHGDPGVPARTYTAGQALFDARNPVKLLARTDAPFLRPTEPYERSGQYKEGTTFVEGVVRFQGAVAAPLWNGGFARRRGSREVSTVPSGAKRRGDRLERARVPTLVLFTSVMS